MRQSNETLTILAGKHNYCLHSRIVQREQRLNKETEPQHKLQWSLSPRPWLKCSMSTTAAYEHLRGERRPFVWDVFIVVVPVDLKTAVTLERVKETKVNCPAVMRLRGANMPLMLNEFHFHLAGMLKIQHNRSCWSSGRSQLGVSVGCLISESPWCVSHITLLCLLSNFSHTWGIDPRAIETWWMLTILTWLCCQSSADETALKATGGFLIKRIIHIWSWEDVAHSGGRGV